jgi:hypothetical protein
LRRGISNRSINSRLEATIICGPRNVIAQDEVNRSKEDRIGKSDATCQPELQSSFRYPEVFAEREYAAGDFRRSVKQGGLHFQHELRGARFVPRVGEFVTAVAAWRLTGGNFAARMVMS